MQSFVHVINIFDMAVNDCPLSPFSHMMNTYTRLHVLILPPFVQGYLDSRYSMGLTSSLYTTTEPLQQLYLYILGVFLVQAPRQSHTVYCEATHTHPHTHTPIHPHPHPPPPHTHTHIRICVHICMYISLYLCTSHFNIQSHYLFILTLSCIHVYARQTQAQHKPCTKPTLGT